MREFFSLRSAMFAAIAMMFMFGTSGVIATDEDGTQVCLKMPERVRC